MNQQLPAYLQNKQTQRGLTSALDANLGVGSPPYLSIMGNRFSLIDGAGEEHAVATYDPKLGPYLDCVIIDVLERTSKIYYDKPFDPGAQQYEPPACWSDNGIAPSRNANKPQSRTCAECQWGMWGSKTSAVSGKGVKACNDVQKVALLVPGYEMPFLLRVPPNSRNSLRGYNQRFKGQAFEMCDVLTRVTFEQGTIGMLAFNAVGWLDEATVVPQRDKLLAAKATDSLIGRTDLPRQEALPAPQTSANWAAEPTASPPAGQQFLTSAPVNPAPFVPPAAAPAPAAPAAAFQQPMAGPAAAPTPQADQPRRRRRTAAEMQAANQPAPAQQPVQQQPVAPQAAPFLPPAASPAAQPFMPPGSATPAQGGPGNATFGMQPGAAPNPDMQSALDGLFGPPK